MTTVQHAFELPSRGAVEAAAAMIRDAVAPSPQICWPLLSQRCGAEVWVKHENHNPTGAFKVRGGLTYIAGLKRRAPRVAGVIAATRGNHGQSIALAAGRFGIPATVVVPHGNSVEKNAAMAAYGARLIEHGADFNEAFDHASRLAAEQSLHMVPSYHEDLIVGVATYSLELLTAVSDLDAVYVPIGMGSGISGMIAMRDALGLATRIVGVVSAAAPGVALSLAAGKVVPAAVAPSVADGLSVRVPNAHALEVIRRGTDRVLVVSDDEVRAAMRHLYSDTHNLAEGAGAAALAGLLQEMRSMPGAIAGKRVAVVLSGGNVDRPVYAKVLGENPS